MKKLVRDKIPAIIAKSGAIPDFYVAKQTEYEQRLLDKMVEELEEFREKPCIEEAADMYSVFQAICDHWQWSLAAVAHASHDKSSARGGFQERFILNLDQPEEEEEDWNVNAHGEQV